MTVARSPAEYYIKYLLLRGMTHLNINKVLEGAGMPRCKGVYLEEVKTGMTVPRPFRPEAQTGMVPRWLKRQKLWPAFHHDDYMVEALDILGSHDLRRIVEPLVLSGCPDEQVADLVRDRTGTSLYGESIRYYRHFFWNRDLLSAAEWEEFLHSYPEGRSMRGIYEEGPQMAMWRLGHASDIDPADMLKAVQSEAFHRFMQSHVTGANDFNAAKTASKWADVLFEATRLRSASEDRLSDVIARFEQICLKHTDGDVPSIEVIAGKLYSRREVDEGRAQPVIDVDVDNSLERLKLPSAEEAEVVEDE